MNVLVTGGAGYIGSITSQKLIERGHKVVIVDDLSTGCQDFIPQKAHFFNMRVQETKQLHELILKSQIEFVLHFAGRLDVAESMVDPVGYYENNFNGTLSLLSAMKSTNANKIIFSSTAAVYKDPGHYNVSEESFTEPLSPYGKSKLMSENLIRETANSLGLTFGILRYFNVAGASRDLSRGPLHSHSSSLFKRVAMAASGKISHFEIFGDDYPTDDGTGVRDYIHVEDLAQIHIKFLDYLTTAKISQVLNCGYGRGYSVREVLKQFEIQSGQQIPIKISPRRNGDLPKVVSEVKKISEIISWTPQYSGIHQIVESALSWEKKQNYK